MNYINKKIGILGGGQLGKMLCLSAANLHVETSVLDPSADSPVSLVCPDFRMGDYRDYQAVYDFGKRVDIVTIEVENVNTDALMRLAEEGVEVYPDPQVLGIIQDKGLQKQFYLKKGLSTAAFQLFNSSNEIRRAVETGQLSLPFVQKLRRSGYDGLGVKVVRSTGQLADLLEGPSVAEACVPVAMELSVIVSRDRHGNIRWFPPAEMVFDPQANLVKYLVSPARIPANIARDAESLAVETIRSFEITGILAVEMFLDTDGNLLINEVAPRPHNSGHHTIESAFASQYDQHIRAILGLPLGNPETFIPAVMINLLGTRGLTSEELVVRLKKCMEMEGTRVHLYGKKDIREYRKLGHITIIDKEQATALQKAEHIMHLLYPDTKSALQPHNSSPHSLQHV